MLNNTYEIRVESKPENLKTVSDFIENLLVGRKCLTSFLISIDEIFSNVVKFAYGESRGEVTFRLSLSETDATLSIIDSGVPFNPVEAKEPDLTLSAEERQIGGLGILLVKKLMDNVSYERTDGLNILTLTKNFS